MTIKKKEARIPRKCPTCNYVWKPRVEPVGCPSCKTPLDVKRYDVCKNKVKEVKKHYESEDFRKEEEEAKGAHRQCFIGFEYPDELV
jgi:hypothetical protein